MKFLMWLLLAAVCLPLLSRATDATSSAESSPGMAQFSRPTTLPLIFERNQGQANATVKFLGRALGYTVFLTSTSALLRVPLGGKRDLATIAFVPLGNGRTPRRIVGENQLAT